MPKLPTLLASLALAACAGPAAREGAAPSDGVLPVASRPLVLPAPQGSEPTLLAIVEQLAEIGGAELFVTEESRQVLAETPLGLFGPAEVPPAEAWSFAEALLCANNAVLVDHAVEGRRVLQVVSLHTNERSGVRAGARYVPHERLPDYERHSALLITTVLPLPGNDMLVLANSLRTILVDPNTQQIVPAGAGDGLVLTGTGSFVASTARMLAVATAAGGAGTAPADEEAAEQAAR
jgi:hypothetical protein